MDIRRFGVGHRRPDGPAGVIAELAFGRRGRITPHTNANAAWFIVIEGGGWVGVGDEKARIQAGEAVAWPADVVHAAWTEGTQMRAIVVEFEGPTLALPGIVEGDLVRIEPAAPRRPVTKGEGRLAERTGPPRRRPEDEVEGEPL